MKRPVVLVRARRTTRKNRFIDYVGELHLELLIRLRTLPVIVPVVTRTPACLPQYMEWMDGLLLVEGEDIEPKRFAARKANFQYLEKTHPLKDEIEIRLVRHALHREVPILGICRGSQLLNVVCGGTLYGDVQREKGSHRPHIDYHNYDTYRHPLSIFPGTRKTISEIRFRKRWIDLLPSLLPLANPGYSLNRHFSPRVLALHEPTVSAADHTFRKDIG
jgi:gamma-glutamyl-gamma-aminobutyrate hydrolase PuuD